MRRRSLLIGAALAAGLGPAQAAQATHDAQALEDDESALFMPGTARFTEDGRLEVDIHAWIYEREHRWGLDTALARYLGLSLRKLSPAAQLRFRQRTALFHCESEAGKAIDVVFDGDRTRHALPPSGADGRTDARLIVDAPRDAASKQWLDFQAVTGRGELLRRFKGRALIVPAQGVSIISDIDDTIKRTQVRERREMLLNTFARRFEAVPQMAGYYRALARAPDTRFHYLSASPMQLYPALAEFMRDAGFPAGSTHLRESTTWRTLVPGDGESRAHKLGVIERLMNDFPQRRFLLVGDSGEADPEIYAQVFREHPGRVDAIVIRDASGEDRLAQRYRETFDGIDPVRWHLIDKGTTAWPVQAAR